MNQLTIEIYEKKTTNVHIINQHKIMFQNNIRGTELHKFEWQQVSMRTSLSKDIPAGVQ